MRAGWTYWALDGPNIFIRRAADAGVDPEIAADEPRIAGIAGCWQFGLIVE